VSFDVLSDLNWLAVIVAGLAYFALGAVWYMPPVFGKPWMAAGGQQMTQAGERPNPAIYATPLVAQIVAAIALGMLAKATGTNTLGEGFVLGLVVGIGFALTIMLVTSAFETRKPNAFVWGLINAAYHLVGLVIAAVIVAVWT
jgi:hypothetical protein